MAAPTKLCGCWSPARFKRHLQNLQHAVSFCWRRVFFALEFSPVLEREMPFTLSRAHFIGLFAFVIFIHPAVAIAQEAGAEGQGFWSLLFDKGGVVTWVIALLSAVGLPIAAVKLYQFHKMTIWRSGQLNEVMQAYRLDATLDVSPALAQLPHPAAALMSFSITQARAKTMPPALLREELGRRAQYLLRHLGRHIWVLELIAASAPLFGLLGTVLGMIVAFQGVGQGSGGADTAILASGIWEALLTTAFGLAVALPFSILSAVLNNAVDDVRDMIEDALSDILVRNGCAE
jgi:biopolymer transport protein ExbB